MLKPTVKPTGSIQDSEYRIWSNVANCYLVVEDIINHISIDKVEDNTIKFKCEGCVIEQHNGALDKNDKKIFVGDIVKGEHNYVNGLENYVVGFQFGEITPLQGQIGLSIGRNIYYEVVGNIHTNNGRVWIG